MAGLRPTETDLMVATFRRLNAEHGVTIAQLLLTVEDVLAEFDHPLWRDLEEMSAGAGHGGMDFLEDYRLVKCLREGLPTDMNVYDAAALSAVAPLSEWSVANGSRPVAVPDFTRGRWQSYPVWEVVRA